MNTQQYPAVIYDTFTDTDGVSITSHALDTTPSTSVWSQTAGTSFQILSNSLQGNRMTDGDIAVINTGLLSYSLSVVVTPFWLSSSNKSMPDIVVRYTDASNFWYVYPDTQTNNIYLYQVSSGTHTKLVTYPFTQSNGTPISVRVDCFAANITIWLNGKEIVTYTHTANLTSTIAGVRLGVGPAGAGAGKCSWDNFKIQNYLGSAFNWPVFIKGSSPVVAKGTGTQWDATDANNPNVAFDATNNRLVLDYSGYYNGGSAPGTKVQHAGQAYLSGPDPSVGTWTKDAGNPLISSNAGDGIYAFNGGLVKKGSTWYRLYCTNGATQIALATSPDLTTWTRQGIVFSAGAVGQWDAGSVYDPFVRLRQDGVTFEMWYGAKDSGGTRRAGYATSIDGVNWTRYSGNPVINLPLWISDNTILGEPSVFVPTGKEGTEMLVSYDCCRSGIPGNRWIAQALTVDGGATWSHRMIASQAGSGWESAQNFDSFIYQYGSNLYLFYSGADLTGAALNLDIQIGMSTAYWPYESLIRGYRSTASTRTAVS